MALLPEPLSFLTVERAQTRRAAAVAAVADVAAAAAVCVAC